MMPQLNPIHIAVSVLADGTVHPGLLFFLEEHPSFTPVALEYRAMGMSPVDIYEWLIATWG